MANRLYTQQGRIEVGIQFNGVYFPLDTLNLLNFLQIGWTTRTKVPTCHFAISDVQHTLDTISLQDGIPITISVRAYGQQTQIYNFRKFHHEKTFNGSNFVYEIDGYLDNPLYWAGTATASFNGTSGELMSYVAQQCGMTSRVATTADSQLWMPRNMAYGEWVGTVMQRGYANSGSYMMAGVDPTGNGLLLYQDVNNLPEPKINMVLGQIIEGSLICTQYAPIATSGLGNKYQGYQHTRYDQSTIATADPQPMDQLTYVPDVSGYYLNQAVSTKIKQGYRSYGGIDSGNTHPQYEQALYQNRRMASLYSLGVEFLYQTPSSLTLFDRFTFAVDQEQQKADVAYAGTYTVAAKAIYIQGPNYVEKVLGVRQGTMQSYVSA